MTKRTNGYQTLKNALLYTCQSGALDILEKCPIGASWKQVGPIAFDQSVPLAVGKQWTQVFMGRMEHHGAIAVKQILYSPKHKEHFQRELSILKKLASHSNIVQFFHAEIDADKLYIALELCSYTLQDCVQRESYPIPGIEILKQATKGLRFLHDNNIIHRDLKPSNILLKVELNVYTLVKLSDFDMSKILEDSIQITSQVVGSPGYAAPEILKYKEASVNVKYARLQRYSQSQDVDVVVSILFNRTLMTNFVVLFYFVFLLQKVTPALDIFSLGCIFYYVLTGGEHPFGTIIERDNNLSKCIHKSSETEYIDDGRIYHTLIHEMIDKDPQNRPRCKQIQENIKLREYNHLLEMHEIALEKAVAELEKDLIQMLSINTPHESGELKRILNGKCALVKKSLKEASVSCEPTRCRFLDERENFRLEQVTNKYMLVNKTNLDLKSSSELEIKICCQEYQIMLKQLHPTTSSAQELLQLHRNLSGSVLKNVRQRYELKSEEFCRRLIEAVQKKMEDEFDLVRSSLEFDSRTHEDTTYESLTGIEGNRNSMTVNTCLTGSM